MKSKWHNISIPHESFQSLLGIQKALPIKASIPQVIEWLIGVGVKNIKQEVKGDLLNEDTGRIPK
jgi:hypothetical protein|tara:strand:- start:2637 stop:2831 length:195 start_codon:yes stop_codon:yes gene_type:complete